MADNKKPYRELKAELDEVLDWFENEENLDVDQALLHYEKAKAIIKQLEDYLKETKTKISKVA